MKSAVKVGGGVANEGFDQGQPADIRIRGGDTRHAWHGDRIVVGRTPDDGTAAEAGLGSGGTRRRDHRASGMGGVRARVGASSPAKPIGACERGWDRPLISISTLSTRSQPSLPSALTTRSDMSGAVSYVSAPLVPRFHFRCHPILTMSEIDSTPRAPTLLRRSTFRLNGSRTFVHWYEHH